RRALPDAEVTLIGLPFARDLVERSRHLDRFEPFPGFPGIAEQWFDARAATAFLARMQARRFDLALQLHGSGLHSNPFALLLGARFTAGFIRADADPGRLDVALPWPAALHERRRSLAFASFLGAPPDGEAMEFPLVAADLAEADRLLAGLDPPLIGLHPFAREEAKCWPAAAFRHAARRLRAEIGGSVVILGGRDDRAAGDRLAAAIGPPLRNLAGATSLGGLGAVVGRLALLIGNDSSPAHIASALATPSVVLFGPTDPAEWGPPADGPHRVVRFDDAYSPAEWHASLERVVATALAVIGGDGAERTLGGGMTGAESRHCAPQWGGRAPLRAALKTP
ncbi:MAG TPA: glycosyltransferase family 9 protein, partial [Thermomicrobiales bacterium]|nr:glycosyltransferase family 9 protein [Thermomicrobiales bacterium]